MGENNKPKRLYRSTEERMLCGVCGGLAEYLNMDPSIVRLVAVIIAFSGYGVLAYIVAAVVIPDKVQSTYNEEVIYEETVENQETNQETTD